jgi:AraC family transcriptional regulator
VEKPFLAKIHAGGDAPWSPVDVSGHPQALEVCLALRGRAHVGLERQRLSHVPGQHLIVAPSEQHSCWTEKDPAGIFIVHLDTSALTELAADVGVPRPEWRSGIASTSEVLRRALARLAEEHARPASDPLRRIALESSALQVAITLFRVELRRDPKDRAKASGAGKSLQRAEESMRESPAGDHSLHQLATLAGMSPFHFIRVFKQTYGMTPRAYLLDLRVKTAAQRIRMTDRSLTHIAFDLGFGSSSRLTEAFKKAYGVTPSEWRRRLA